MHGFYPVGTSLHGDIAFHFLFPERKDLLGFSVESYS